MAREAYRSTPEGLELRVRLTPRADRDTVDGLSDMGDLGRVISARVRAVPEKGAANAAAERLIADWLNVAPSSVSLESGTTQRIKTLRVRGDGAALAARLAKQLK